jgi:pimeloyl-ACP methyl ester carboxylesterase
MPTLTHIRTPTLEIAFEDSGPHGADPVILLHGFPYDPRAFDGMIAPLTAAGFRTIVPYLRGFGPTRFLSAETPRSGQQAALANDLRELMDALALPVAALCGYDWGGRAACIAAALWPERVRCLVSMNGYLVQDIPNSGQPASPEQEHRFWYMYYFNTPRGEAGLTAHRRALCKLLWRQWSPHWDFDDATYDRSAASFDNPDFVDIVIHSYRHRLDAAPGDPALQDIEDRLTRRPPIPVPTINLHGDADGVGRPPAIDTHGKFFTGPYERRIVARGGHNMPQEMPGVVAGAMLELLKVTA